MKDYIALEINSKKETLCTLRIETPNEFLLVPNTESILNNRIFEEFIDNIFWFTVNELAYEFDEKIDNVYISFLDNDGTFMCSIIIDKFKPKKGKYRMEYMNWQASGHTFKYIEDTKSN